ncbi:MAG TPA: hypothetical protein VFB91_07605 [Terriglobales bacterium]|nr:hypothetical protein [Terriglobales bacterium]
MKASVIRTETLALRTCRRSGSLLTVMNSRMSGWSTRVVIIRAPRRPLEPPMTPVTVENTSMKLTEPELSMPALRTRAPQGRSTSMFVPTPPPKE